MPKTVTRTVRDIVIADVKSVTISGPMDVPADMKVQAVATLFDSTTGDVVDKLAFEVLPNQGTLTALSNILKNAILANANDALQSRGASDVEIPPV